MEISGLKRKISKLASTNEKEEKHKGVFTDGEPYIHIINRMSYEMDDDAIFIGKEYHGEGSGKRKSKGKENIYVRFSQRKPNSKLSSKGLNLRVRLFFWPCFLELLWYKFRMGISMGMNYSHYCSE